MNIDICVNIYLKDNVYINHFQQIIDLNDN